MNSIDQRNTRNRAQVKAIVGRPLEPDLVERTIKLIEEYQEVPLNSFLSLFEIRYNKIFDVSALGFDDGLKGYFSQLRDTIILKKNENGVWKCYPKNTVTLKPPINGIITEPTHCDEKENSVPNFVDWLRKRKRDCRLQSLFSKDNTVLWTEEFQPLINLRYRLSLSPYESALKRKPLEMRAELEKIKRALRRYPTGINLNCVCLVYHMDKRLFNVPSVETATVEYPEIFYRIEPEEDGTEPSIFDGTTKTYNDLNGSNIDRFVRNSDLIIYKSIASGIYQKTLLLIREAGILGLKLASWYQSIMDNFREPVMKSKYEAEILDMAPLTLFQILASRKLVEIKSHVDSKNDLRIHFPPQKIDFLSFFYSLITKIKADRKEIRARLCAKNATLEYSRQLSHDTIDEMCLD